MIAMQIIVPMSHMNTREHRSGRCADLSHPDKHCDFWLFTARSITSFVWVGIYFEQRTIGS